MEQRIQERRKDLQNLSFLIVTANKYEKQAVESKLCPLKKYGRVLQLLGKNIVYNVGAIGQYMVAHIHLDDQGSTKKSASMLTIYGAMQESGAKAVIVVGIGYGADKKKQDYGDVMISSGLMSINYLKIGKVIENRNTLVTPGKTILNKFINNWQNDFSPSYRGIFKPKIHIGVILSGDYLLANADYKKRLINFFQSDLNKGKNKYNIIGGEMEGVGLSSAMNNLENGNWIIIKGISDFGEEDKNENKEIRQQIAANNAMNYCYELLKTKTLQDIPGIVTINSRNKGSIKLAVNCYNMYYYRNMQKLTFERLSKLTGIEYTRLRDLEDITLNNNGDIQFPYATENEIAKINNFIHAEVKLYETQVEDKTRKFYQNKERHSFIPVENSKIAFFDFDGTMTTNKFTAWEVIWETLGFHMGECEALHRKFMNRDITHEQWCNITEEYFKSKGLNLNIMKTIADNIEMLNYVEETIKILNSHNVKMYICSGAIDTLIELKLKDISDYFIDKRSNSFAYDRMGNFQYIKGTKYDFEGKAKYIDLILSKNHNVSANDCIFIGNSINDELVFKSGVKTLAVNPMNTAKYDRKIWNYNAGSIEDFRKIIPYVLPEDYTFKDF